MSEENQEPVMRDFLDQGFYVGDGVVVSVATGGNNGRKLAKGIIVGFTTKQVRVESIKNGRVMSGLFPTRFVIKHDKVKVIMALS